MSNIRSATPDDLTEILNIYASSKLDELRYEEKEFNLLPLDKDPKRWDEFEESNAYVYDVGSVLGYGAICGGEIRALYVSPSARGKGVGKALLEYFLERMSGNVILYIAVSNVPAKGLYEKYGFEVVEEFKTHYNGVSVLAAKMMLKR